MKCCILDVKVEIFVVFPPMEKNEAPIVMTVPISSQAGLQHFCKLHRGSLTNSTDIMATYKTLVPNGTYKFIGAFYKANVNDTRRRQVDDKVLEFESALVVKNFVGGDAHIHPNVVFYDEKKIPQLELDAVVHLGGEGVANSTVYIIEAAFSPKEKEVQVLIDKVARFRTFAQEDVHFKAVTEIIPVLAGRHWLQSTAKAATAAKRLRVIPSAGGYQVVRGLHVLVKRMVK